MTAGATSTRGIAASAHPERYAQERRKRKKKEFIKEKKQKINQHNCIRTKKHLKGRMIFFSTSSRRDHSLGILALRNQLFPRSQHPLSKFIVAGELRKKKKNTREIQRTQRRREKRNGPESDIEIRPSLNDAINRKEMNEEQ